MHERGTGSRGPEYVGPADGGFRLPRLPRRLTRILIVVALLLIVPLLLARSFFVYVRPNEYGIKEVKVGVKRGIQEKVYPPGLAFVMPFGLERMHRFPRNVQVLELTAYGSPAYQSAARQHDPAAKIQTSDGFYVDVEVTVLYRIADPYKVMVSLGPGPLFLENGIRPKAEPILKEALGELTTEDFYNSPMRVAKARMARDALSAELEPKGLQVDHVLVRYFKYSEEIQRNIEEKKLQDQLVFKNQAEARAAAENAKLKRATQEGEMNVKVTLEQGHAYKVEKDAERELYVRKREAEADLLVKLAEAKSTELRNTAMQAAGADRKVAMAMAEVLQGMDVLVVPVGGESGVNALDLDSLIELFGVDKAGRRAVSRPPRPIIETPEPKEILP